MIFESLREYEEKAVFLALNRPKLQELTNRLKAARLTCPLFDTARWVSTCVPFVLICQLNLILLLYILLKWKKDMELDRAI